MKYAALALTLPLAALHGAGCRALQPCQADAECGPAARCHEGSCFPEDELAQGDEGEREPAEHVEALVAVRGVDALAGVLVTLPLELEPVEVEMAPVGVDDCAVSIAAVDDLARFPVTLALACDELHLGQLALPLLVSGADVDLEVALTVRFVPSDWLDLERTERELISVDTGGVLQGAPVPVGAPVFVGAERLAEGALAQSPRLLTVEGGAQTEVAWQEDGGGLWFALPASGRVWLYYAAITGVAEAAPVDEPGATPWSSFAGVWHLDSEDDAVGDAALVDGAQDLDGEALPTPGVVGGGAGFTGTGGLFTELAFAPTSGTLSAWMQLDGATAGAYQAAVSIGGELAEGTFDPEAVALYASEVEQACGHLGAGIGEASTQRCSTVSPAAMSDAAWHHVAWTWHGEERVLVVDGMSFNATGVAPAAFGLEVLAIGSAIDGDFPWVGAVDEVRFASSALPATWFKVEHASVTDLITTSGRPFVQGLRPDLLTDSEVVSSQGEPLAPVSVVPTLARGVLIAFVAARGAPADGAGFDDVTLARLAPSAVGSDLSLTALSWQGPLDGAPLSVTHTGQAPAQAVIGTVAFAGGTSGASAGVDLAMQPVVTAGPQLALAATASSAPPTWMLVAVASRQGVARCDACGRHVLGPVDGGPGLVLDVFAGEREPSAHVLEPITVGDDAAAVVVVRVGP